MNNLAREYIAISFNDDSSKMMPIIKMDGTEGLKKVIHSVSAISKIFLYHVDFQNQMTDTIGSVLWPDDIFISDVAVQYEPEKMCVIVRIIESDQVWTYSVEKKDIQSPDIAKTEKKLKKSTEINTIIDTDKVRQLEEKAETKTVWPDELAEELKKDVLGQDEGIKKVSEVIATNLRRKTPEVEVIVLFGPTGVGKTETGKAIPAALKKLTGQEYGFQQIPMNQYVESHSLHQWFGSPPSYVGYKDPTIFEPCRDNKYQVFLLDEIEKSTPKIWMGMMECFSNSSVKLQDNSPEIDLSHSIFILTSNVPIDMVAYNTASEFKKKEICRDALTRTCGGHPEIAGKIGNCLAFQKLPEDAVTRIVLKFVIQELRNYDMVLAHMDEHLMVNLKKMHRNSEYGARSVKDAVRTALVFTAYDRNIDKYKGKGVTLSGDVENIVIKVAS